MAAAAAATTPPFANSGRKAGPPDEEFSTPEAAAAELARSLDLPSTIAALLVRRGIRTTEEAAQFLNPSLAGLHSPYLMLDMRPAVDRVLRAIAQGERILIYGDYDVDGTMATVILKTAIELCGGRADFHVPHRLLEGYGMRDEVIERAAAEGVRLIISVDTGIRAFAAAETAHSLGVDLIVTDHHLPVEDKNSAALAGGSSPELFAAYDQLSQAASVDPADDREIPRALAVLNPNRRGCGYPCKFLCGAGVAFKLAQALLEHNGRERLIPSFLKIVAIATIADSVPLVGENRIFVSLGLEELRRPVNPGLRALLEVSGIEGGRPLTTGEIAFRIAPRMNAAGRMDVACAVVDLFNERDPERARQLAERLNQLNGERQQEEARIMEAIYARLEGSAEVSTPAESLCLVVDGEGWHRGVIGICASRLVDRYFRPALVIARDGDEAHGSGRSIPGFHLLHALEQCPQLFTRFGGHAHAVGFAMPAGRIDELREHLNCFARSSLTPEQLEPMVEYDLEIPLEEIGPKLWGALGRMQPFGIGNPQPVFVARGTRLLAPPKVLKEKHLKLRVAPASTATTRPIEALGWGMAPRFAASQPEAAADSASPLKDGVPKELRFDGVLSAGDVLDLVFTIERNDHPEFGGHLELCLCDVAHSSS